EYRFRALDLAEECAAGVAADVENHLVGRHSVDRDIFTSFSVRIFGDNDVLRQHDLDAPGRRLLEELSGRLELIVLDQRGADLLALRLEEGVRHAAAHQDGVDPVEQVPQNVDLVGNLRATDDGDEGVFRCL